MKNPRKSPCLIGKSSTWQNEGYADFSALKKDDWKRLPAENFGARTRVASLQGCLSMIAFPPAFLPSLTHRAILTSNVIQLEEVDEVSIGFYLMSLDFRNIEYWKGSVQVGWHLSLSFCLYIYIYIQIVTCIYIYIHKDTYIYIYTYIDTRNMYLVLSSSHLQQEVKEHKQNC